MCVCVCVLLDQDDVDDNDIVLDYILFLSIYIERLCILRLSDNYNIWNYF